MKSRGIFINLLKFLPGLDEFHSSSEGGEDQVLPPRALEPHSIQGTPAGQFGNKNQFSFLFRRIFIKLCGRITCPLKRKICYRKLISIFSPQIGPAGNTEGTLQTPAKP